MPFSIDVVLLVAVSESVSERLLLVSMLWLVVLSDSVVVRV